MSMSSPSAGVRGRDLRHLLQAWNVCKWFLVPFVAVSEHTCQKDLQTWIVSKKYTNKDPCLGLDDARQAALELFSTLLDILLQLFR